MSTASVIYEIPCVYLTGPEPLVLRDLHKMSREQAGEEIQRLAASRQPGVVVGVPDIIAFFAVRAKLEKVPSATQAELRAIFQSLWPEASRDFRAALEIGFSYALQAIGVGATAQVVRAAVNELSPE